MLWLPKFKEGIRIRLHRKFKGVVKTVTISKSTSGKYFASILIEDNINAPNLVLVNKDNAIGIDLGLVSLLTLSNGEEFENPRYLRKSIGRLKVLQRRVSRKNKGSNNRKRASVKLAILHEKIANQRNDFLHKISDEITNRFDTICIEDLAISNMVKNHKLSQSIGDAGWGILKVMIEYKSKWKGHNVIKIGRWEPSSKICSACSEVKKSLSLIERSWVCDGCGVIHDRDINAAKNILDIGIRKYSGREPSVEHPEPLVLTKAMMDEMA